MKIVLRDIRKLRKSYLNMAKVEKFAGNIIKEESLKGVATGLFLAENMLREFLKDLERRKINENKI